MKVEANQLSRVLLVESEDRPGLVHGVTGVLFRAGLNVVANHEFVDAASHRFYMRTEVCGVIREHELLEEVRTTLPPGAMVRLPGRAPTRIVAMASKEHHCLADLLVRHSFGELPVTIAGVVSNHQNLRPLAEKFGIPFFFIPAEGLSRNEHEAGMLSVLDRLQPEYLVLAKYMRILSGAFVARWPRGIINIHHSFLPAFAGARPYHQAFERGVKVIGATAHFVTEQLDEGPIIEQQVLPVDHSHTPQSLAQAGRDVEQMTLARALRLVFEHRVFLCGRRTVIFD
jgi:formyltetrahydrofolate deformylase